MTAALVLVACVLGACTDAPEPRSAPEPVGSTTPPPSASPACANQQDALASGEPVGGTEKVDVDGDERPDEVGIYVAERAEPGCEAFLRVDTSAGSTVAGSVWEVGAAGGIPEPTLHSFVQLDGEPGYEIVVNEAAGASTQFVAAYTVGAGEIVPIEVPDAEGGLFGFGGSVGHLEAVDCSSDGDIAIVRATPAAGRAALREGLYTVRRFVYTFSGGEVTREAAEVYPKVPLDDLNRQFPEFATSPFGSCAAP